MDKFKQALSACDEIEIGNITELPTFWAKHGKTVLEALEMAAPKANDKVLSAWREVATGLFPSEIFKAHPDHAVTELAQRPTDKDAQEALEILEGPYFWNGLQYIKEFIGDRRYEVIRRALSAPSREVWQPIETAPKDKDIILGYNKKAGDDDDCEIVTQGRWYEAVEDGYDYMGHDAGWMDNEHSYFHFPRSFGVEAYMTSGKQPTHWMPLPPSPPAHEKEKA
jgi:hypothetical protein